ncbi:MAG: sigma-70 family RNA polymerase sigma factor [Clostridia bacterium]|jgi:RNA polymerase sporulation-specific sigma factor|nr:sigma-70 family RNA polymerase sigma factor [Clostridia bacterium]
MEKEKIRKESELIALAQSGDGRAMEELLSRYANMVKSCARGFFLIGGEAEDLIQEGMVGLYAAIVDYRDKEDGSSFKNFAYMCVKRRIIDAVKRASSKKNSPLNDGVSAEEVDGWLIYSAFNPEDSLILSDERRELKQEMIRVLSDFEYKVFTLYMEGMSGAQICEATGKTEKSVSNALQRSKTKLQEVFRKER